ncbi:MAG: hypothetical protein M3P08_09215 [Thermoproteota archaeon]|nr:hypothetical protein [Thermoproteota archaeon]
MNQHFVITLGVTIALASLIIIFLNSSNMVFAQIPYITSSRGQGSTANHTTSASASSPSSRTMTELNLTNATGDISSLQNNATGKPTWLVTGKWNLSVPIMRLSSQSGQITHALFNASFNMIKLDGTGKHKYTISNFKLTGTPLNNNVRSATFIGTATIILKDGPHKEVPIVIKLLNQGAISITPDPSKVNEHFGNTPIYGIVWKTH